MIREYSEHFVKDDHKKALLPVLCKDGEEHLFREIFYDFNVRVHVNWCEVCGTTRVVHSYYDPVPASVTREFIPTHLTLTQEKVK